MHFGRDRFYINYAFRAKNIRKKPQVNSNDPKKYSSKGVHRKNREAQERNDSCKTKRWRYLTNEQYEDITVESESRRILSEEQKARIEIMGTSLRNKVQKLFNLTDIFTILKRHNETTRATLHNANDVLFKTEMVLSKDKERFEDETAIGKA